MKRKYNLIFGIVWFGVWQTLGMFSLIMLGSRPFETVNIFAGFAVMFGVWFFGTIQYNLIDEYHKEKLRTTK